MAQGEKQKSVWFYSHTGQISGAEHVLLLTMSQLDKDEFSATLLSPGEGPLRAEAAERGVPWKRAEAVGARFTLDPYRLMKYAANLVDCCFSFRRAVQKARPDLIHANSVRAGLVATFATTGSSTPVIWHLHDILPQHPLSRVIRLVARSSERTWVLGCSQAAARSVGRVDERVFAALNGIRADEIASSEDAMRVREELGFTRDQVLIGIVGQITSRKGHDGLIRAFSELAQQNPSLQLVIVGAAIFNKDHEYKMALEKLVRGLQLETRVHFVGKRRDVPAVMKALDVLVLNSAVEPFGLVILEALLQGTPVIATDSGGPSEIIRHRENGHLVPVGDTGALQAALREVLSESDLRAKYALNGPATVRNFFTAETYIATVQAVYRKVLHEVPHPNAMSAEQFAPERMS